MILGDQGADVIRVDEPGWIARRMAGDGAFYGPLLEILDRNKRSIQVDLKAPGGADVVKRLVEDADVFIECLRPGVADRLGVGYEALSAVNERLIFASLTGYGQDGPYAQVPGHDLNYIALTGMLDFGFTADQQPEVPNLPFADMAGAMQLTLGILTALVDRHRTGKGQRIDASMSDVMAAWMITPLALLLSRDGTNAYAQWADRVNSPYYNVYRCADGRYVSLGCNEPWLWAKLCNVIGHPELIERQHLEGEARRAVLDTVAQVLASKDRDDWVTLLRNADVPVAPVLSLEESFTDPHIVHRQLYVEAQSPSGIQRTIGDWLKLSGSPGTIRHPAPHPGQHTDEILHGLGYDDSRIGELRNRGTVA